MEQVSYSPPHVHMDPHMYDLMVPLTLYGTNIIWSPTCTYGPPHVRMVPTHVQSDAPHLTVSDSYGPPYLIWNRYLMVLPTLLSMTLLVPKYLIWNRYLMVPPYLIQKRYCMVPHMYNLMVPSYLIWNMYCMLPPTCMYGPPTCTIWCSPLTLHGTGIIWSPHIHNIIFSDQLQKRSTACPNN